MNNLMSDVEKKMQVLSSIAHALNEKKVVWAVGASMLLYFKGIVDHFNDIDIMVTEKDIQIVKQQLLLMGMLNAPNMVGQYRTRHFLEFQINDIDVDVMAGFVIVKDEKEYDCSLMPEQIAEYIDMNGERIPLQSLSDWRRYYELMGRTAKVKMIDDYNAMRDFCN